MSDSAESVPHVNEAVSFLYDYEDLTEEEKRGAIKHAISSLENARREL